MTTVRRENYQAIFPPSFYQFEADLKAKPITIFGDSTKQTIFYALNPNGYVFTLSANGFQNIENVRILGITGISPNSTFNTNGIKCLPRDATGNAGYQPVNLTNVNFESCGIALYKEGTLFGRFDNCIFGGDIGIFSRGSTNRAFNNNYSGFDYFVHCKFMGNNKAAVYYNNSVNTDESQTKFEHCWFEAIKGITCLAFRYRDQFSIVKICSLLV